MTYIPIYYIKQFLLIHEIHENEANNILFDLQINCNYNFIII
jgi:hypothetical protein